MMITILSLVLIFVRIPDHCFLENNNYCWQKIIKIFIIGIINLALAPSFLVSYLYINEVFPTKFRGIGVGLCVLIGNSGGILAQFMTNILLWHSIYP